MDIKLRKQLVESSQGATLEGVPCVVGGWRNEYATLSSRFAGFWHTSWETVDRVLSGDKNFTADDVYLASWGWIGLGEEVPERLKPYIPRE